MDTFEHVRSRQPPSPRARINPHQGQWPSDTSPLFIRARGSTRRRRRRLRRETPPSARADQPTFRSAYVSVSGPLPRARINRTRAQMDALDAPPARGSTRRRPRLVFARRPPRARINRSPRVGLRGRRPPSRARADQPTRSCSAGTATRPLPPARINRASSLHRGRGKNPFRAHADQPPASETCRCKRKPLPRARINPGTFRATRLRRGSFRARADQASSVILVTVDRTVRLLPRARGSSRRTTSRTPNLGPPFRARGSTLPPRRGTGVARPPSARADQPSPRRRPH